MIKFILEHGGRRVTLPVNPGNLTISREGGNENAELVAVGEIAVLRKPRLAKVAISSFFPAGKYPFASEGGTPKENVEFIQAFSGSAKPGRLIVTELGENMQVGVERFEYDRRAGEHEDVYYTLELTEWRPYGAKTLELSEDGELIEQPEERPDEAPKPEAQSYEVSAGDSLWAIARRYGDGDWRALYELNKAVIGGDPGLIKPGQELKLPEDWLK